MIETRNNTYNKPKSGTCHCSDPKPDGTCCNLICFERPNYFCGHLLTDTDLSKEQQYVVEKHKLYNRTLHGSGIVCGLRLTCDEECGGVIIDEGYAIDDCGNDLVVCDPMRFDVLSLLKEKGYVVGDTIYDPCKPKDEQEECDYTQCFYVTICYDEESRDYTTPFIAGCRPTLTECEPTRIRESVRFDVLDKLPEENAWAKELQKRFECCFAIFTTGPFARALNDPTNQRFLREICSSPANIPRGQYDDLFCQLRGLLLLYLQKHPDKYNCKLADQIRQNILPDPKDTQDPNYGQKVNEAFSTLLRLAWQHAISCALGELVPRCPGPDHAGCVVLGTIEVRGGCVTHVCNCPRSYVWSFANFFPVLIATLFGELACEEKEKAVATPTPTDTPRTNIPGTPAGTDIPNQYEKDQERRVCCGELDATCDQLLKLIGVNSRFLSYAGTETISAFSNLAKAVRSAFNFTDANTFSTSMLYNMNQQQFKEATDLLGIENVTLRKAPIEPAYVSPFVELSRIGLGRIRESSLVAEYNDDNVIVNAYAVPQEVNTEASLEMEARVAKAEAAATEANNRTQNLEKKLDDFIKESGNPSDSKLEEFRRAIKEELSRGQEERESAGDKAAEQKRRGRKRPGTPQEEGENG